jgi:hypothetical protein
MGDRSCSGLRGPGMVRLRHPPHARLERTVGGQVQHRAHCHGPQINLSLQTMRPADLLSGKSIELECLVRDPSGQETKASNITGLYRARVYASYPGQFAGAPQMVPSTLDATQYVRSRRSPAKEADTIRDPWPNRLRARTVGLPQPDGQRYDCQNVNVSSWMSASSTPSSCRARRTDAVMPGGPHR